MLRGMRGAKGSVCTIEVRSVCKLWKGRFMLIVQRAVLKCENIGRGDTDRTCTFRDSTIRPSPFTRPSMDT